MNQVRQKKCKTPISFLCLLITACVIVLGLSGCSTTNNAPVYSIGQSTSRTKVTHGYRVQQGENVYSIAWSKGVDYRQLARANHLQSPFSLQSGQVINTRVKHIPLPEVSQYYSKKSEFNHKVTKWAMPAAGSVKNQFSSALLGNHGIDIYGQVGEPIYAAAAGKVVYVGSQIPGYGNLLLVKHSDEFISAYAFTKTDLVNVGDWVKLGQVIAKMGLNNKGQAELHFEIRRNGQPVNPLRFIH